MTKIIRLLILVLAFNLSLPLVANPLAVNYYKERAYKGDADAQTNLAIL
jgi:hypothetical protein